MIIDRTFIRYSIRCIALVFWVLLIIFFLYGSSFLGTLWQSKHLNILAFPQIVDKEFLDDFEKKTGIQVNISYFESSEDLLTKLHTTPNHGYDLFMVADAFVPVLIKEGFIKSVDHTKCPLFNDIYPALLNHSFDPGNRYTIPCFWSVYGLGIDLTAFGDSLPDISWKMLFDKKALVGQIGMLEDLRELFAIASLYLFGRTSNLTGQEISQIKDLLVRQKQWVAVYTDMRIEYLLVSKTCPVVLSSTSDMIKVIKRYPYVRFAVPAEGSFIKIDSYVIASSTEHEDYVYDFLQYIYSPEIMKKYASKFEFFPPIKSIPVEELIPGYSVPTEEMLSQLRFFLNDISQSILEKMWITIRAA